MINWFINDKDKTLKGYLKVLSIYSEYKGVKKYQFEENGKEDKKSWMGVCSNCGKKVNIWIQTNNICGEYTSKIQLCKPCVKKTVDRLTELYQNMNDNN